MDIATSRLGENDSGWRMDRFAKAGTTLPCANFCIPRITDLADGLSEMS